MDCPYCGTPMHLADEDESFVTAICEDDRCAEHVTVRRDGLLFAPPTPAEQAARDAEVAASVRLFLGEDGS
jgi:hypothetical protein